MKTKRDLLKVAIVSLVSVTLLCPVTSRAEQQSGVIAVVWSPAGDKVATANNDGTLRIWDSTQHNLLIELKDPSGRIDTITWKPDGTRIASLGGDDGNIRIWDVNSGKLVAALQGERDSNGLGVVVWSPNGAKIASVICSESAPINIWSAEDDNYKLLLSSGPAAFYAMAWSPDSSKLAIAGILNLYVLDGIATGKLLFHETGPFVISVAWSPDGTKLAGGDVNGPIHILDAKTGKELNTLRGHSKGASALSWNLNGKLLSASHDNTLRIWDTNTGVTLTSVPVNNDIIFAAKLADWSPYGGRLAFHGKAITASSAQTANSLDKEAQISVPVPSSDELQAITKRCASATVQQQLTAKLSAKQYAGFANDVKAMSKDQVPPACAADLIAVANAVQSTP